MTDLKSNSTFDPVSAFARNVMHLRYSHTLPDGRKETWEEIARRVTVNVLSVVADKVDPATTAQIFEIIRDKKFIPGGRYLYAAGRSLHQTQNCLLLRAEDSREGWSTLLEKASMALMTGAGIGIDYSSLREKGAPIRRTGGTASGPLAIMQMVNEIGRYIRHGGSRRSAIWAGLRWNHPDIFDFIHLKDWPAEIRAMKEKDFSAFAPMDGTNISVILDKDFFSRFDAGDARAHDVYWTAVGRMLKTGEPGFSINYTNKNESLRNACTEVVSEDDSDICNLGSINLSKITSLEEMARVTELGTVFLLAGTLYSDLPYPKVAEVRTKNRRLGLGLMGIHEWLIQRGLPYAPCDALAEYLAVYKTVSSLHATTTATNWGISVPVATRAVAPNGTIGIIAETTTSAEPMFCAAYKRRYLDAEEWKFEYVVDPVAARLVAEGVDASTIEDAYSLSTDVERRIAFQAWLQSFVDQSISSTINLPAWGSPTNNESAVKAFGETLYRYLPSLRGITVYPDGARGGQPLTPVPLSEALSNVGKVFIEGADICDISGGGSCGV